MIDWKKLSTAILSAMGEQGKITQILADFETEVTSFNTKLSELEKQTMDYANQIDSLQKTNMNLFLRLGNPVPEPQQTDGEKKLTYEDLFDEKGELK